MASANTPLAALDQRIARVKERLENLDAETFEQLQNVYKYRLVQAELRSTGWVNIFLGGLTLWWGTSGASYSTNPIYDLQALGGAFTLVASLWVVIRPSLPGVRAFAVVFLVAGIWNLYLCFRDTSEGYAFPILLGLLALAQLWWAYQHHKRYQTHRLLVEPSANIVRTYNEIIEAIRWTIPHKDSDLIEVKFKHNWWRGWLLGNLAVLSLKKGKHIFFTREHDVVWTPYPAELGTKKRFNIRLQFNETSTVGVISRESFDRYAQWKSKNNTGRSLEDLQLVGTGKNSWIPFGYLHPLVRIPVLIAGVLAMLMVCYVLFALLLVFAYS